MFILHLKRLKIILGFVLISLFAFSCAYVIVLISLFAFSCAYVKDENNSNKSVEATATPVSGKTVILDAGHRFS